MGKGLRKEAPGEDQKACSEGGCSQNSESDITSKKKGQPKARRNTDQKTLS